MAYRQDQIGARDLRADSVFRLGKGAAETLAGNRTVVDGEGPILSMDAGGSSRNVTLPARALANDGVVLVVHNISTAGENLVIKNSAASTLVTLPSSGVALVFAAVADETPGTREWKAAIIGGEDLALADALTVTGIATLTSTLVVAKQASFTSNAVIASTLALSSNLTVASQGSFTSDVVVASVLGVGKNATFSSGVFLGTATSNLVGAYGGTGASQRASSNQASTNAATSASFGATQLAILQEIMNTLTALSLWKGAA